VSGPLDVSGRQQEGERTVPLLATVLATPGDGLAQRGPGDLAVADDDLD
jgi:hypothetical protein